MPFHLLSISASSKPEEFSTSKTVARYLLKQFIQKYPDTQIEEINLYTANLPLFNYKLFSGRAKLPTPEEFEKLSEEEKQQINRINELCDQFLRADRYIISAPMWSLFFPAILKQYLDCIIIQDKLIDISSDHVKGLLGDKERKMVYVQSSGGIYPIALTWKLNQGLKYLEDTFAFLGMSDFKKILVEGVESPKVGRDLAIQYSKEDIDHLMRRF